MNKLFIGSLGTLGHHHRGDLQAPAGAGDAGHGRRVVPGSCPGGGRRRARPWSRSSCRRPWICSIPQALATARDRSRAGRIGRVRAGRLAGRQPGDGGAAGARLHPVLHGRRRPCDDRALERRRARWPGRRSATSWIVPVAGARSAPREDRACPSVGPPRLSPAEALRRRHGWRGAIAAHAGSGVVRAAYASAAAAPPERGAGCDRGSAARGRSGRGQPGRGGGPRGRSSAHLDAWGKPGEGFSGDAATQGGIRSSGLLNPGRFLGGI